MSGSRFPHTLVLLFGCILVAAALTYVLPSGQYERQADPVTGRDVVVAGTYAPVPPAPVGLFEALVAVPLGMHSAASVIFLIFLVGGAFTVVEETGAIRYAIQRLLRKLEGRAHLAIPLAALPFAAGGALQNMEEEIIPMIPALLILVRRLGFDAVTAVSMSAGAAMVGASFSPINPFQVGIAQELAELPLLSGGLFRTVFLMVALAIWIAATMRYASRNAAPAETAETGTVSEGTRRSGLVLGLVVLAFAVLVYGLTRLDWDFDQMSALFFGMGLAAGLVAGLGLTGTAEAYVRGFREMAFAAVIVGFASAIFVVLEQGRVIDTIVHGLFSPLEGLPAPLTAAGMMGAHVLIHFPVSSVSGQAVLTMPILVPLSDLLGLSRQVTVLAYQYGAGLSDMITPTNGTLMAILATAGIRYDRWLSFAIPSVGLVAILGVIALFAAVAAFPGG